MKQKGSGEMPPMYFGYCPPRNVQSFEDRLASKSY